MCFTLINDHINTKERKKRTEAIKSVARTKQTRKVAAAAKKQKMYNVILPFVVFMVYQILSFDQFCACSLTSIDNTQSSVDSASDWLPKKRKKREKINIRSRI